MLYEYTEKAVQQEDGRTGEDNILHQCRCGDSVWQCGCGDSVWQCGCGDSVWQYGCGDSVWQCGCGDSVWTDVNALKKKAITINVILK